jgi:hypothetical protein
MTNTNVCVIGVPYNAHETRALHVRPFVLRPDASEFDVLGVAPFSHNRVPVNQPVDSLVLRQNELVVFDAHFFAIHRAVSTRDEKTPAISGDRFDCRVVWDLQGLE